MESFAIMLKALICRHERKPLALRRLYDKQQMEDAASQAPLLQSCISELRAAVPLDEHHEKQLTDLIDAFENGDAALELQLQSHSAGKHPNFSYTYIEELAVIAQSKKSEVTMSQ